MKTLNKKLLSTAALLIGLCCLTSFNPLSIRYAYNDVEGSADLASHYTPAENINAVLTAAEAVPDGRSQSGVGATGSCSIYKSRDEAKFRDCMAKLGPQGKQPQAARGKPSEAKRDHSSAGKKDIASSYTIDDPSESIKIKDGVSKDAENTIRLSVPEGIAVIDAVTLKSGKTLNAASKVYVTYHIIKDTEAGVASDCKNCDREEARELARKKTFELANDSYKFEDLKAEILGGKYEAQMKILEQGILDNPHSKLDAKHVPSLRSDDDGEEVAKSPDELDGSECSSDNYSERISCLKTALHSIKSKRKEEDRYNRIMSEISDLAAEEAMSDHPKKAHLSKLKALAKGNREVTMDIDAAITYTTNLDSVKQYRTLLNSYARDAAAIDQQISQMGNCNTMNVQMNWNCNMLALQKEQIVMQAQRDVGGLQNRFRTSLTKYKDADDVDYYKENLGSTYDDFLEPYKNLISSDPKLMSLDSVTPVTATPTPSYVPQNAAQQNSITGLNNGIPMQQNNPRYNPNLPGAQFAAQPNQPFYQQSTIGVGVPSPNLGNGQSWRPGM